MTAPSTANTPLRLVQQAFADAGRSQLGESLDSERIVDGYNRLNDIINMWQTQGLKLWLQQDYPVTLTQGVNLYPLTSASPGLNANPTRAVQGYVLQATSNIRRPLVGPISRDEWSRLSIVTTQGPINQFFPDKQQTSLNINVYLTPDAIEAANSLHLIIQGRILNFTGVTDTMNFPPEWGLGLRWGLADDLATGQPETIMTRCAQKAEAYRMALEGWDVEDASTMFTPDQRSQYAQSQFY